MIPALLARYLGPVLIALGAVLALAALCTWLGNTLEAKGKAQEQAAEDKQALRDSATAREREQAIQATKEESDHEASVFNARAAADRVGAAGAADRLRERFATINGACVPQGAAAVAAGPAASTSADLRAHVLGGIDEAAGQLAAYADSLRSAEDNAVRQHAGAVSP